MKEEFENILIKNLNSKCINILELIDYDLVLKTKLIRKALVNESLLKNCKFFKYINPNFFEVEFENYKIFDKKDTLYFYHNLNSYNKEEIGLIRKFNLDASSLNRDDFKKTWWLVYK